MVFSSVYFLHYFLPVFLLLYFLSPKQWKNGVALLGSGFFYFWGAPEFMLLLIPSLVVDFYLVRLITLAPTDRLRKRLLWVSVFLNVLMLAIAKYLNFFIDGINPLLLWLGSEGLSVARIIVPIGISFITFQRISYILDCYWGKVQPLDKWVDYALYILLFPQLIAGPIVRFNEIASQLSERTDQETIDAKLSGAMRFILGLARKVLLADQLAIVVDEVFRQDPGDLSSATLWIAAIAYSMQIYHDFAGYSDMAIGLARMMGFRFPENFRFPYLSTSITEFWRRWHMTLGRWMRDYLYIPLGGNRGDSRLLYRNLWIVFLLSGLWHGAAWTFVIWGAFHGLFLSLERLFLQKYLDKIGRWLSIVYVYFVILFSWVIFRSPSISYAWEYVWQMFAFDVSAPGIYILQRFWWALAIALLVSLGGWIRLDWEKWCRADGNLLSLGVRVLASLLLGFWCLMEVFGSEFQPFIYFKF
ncbi:MAG: MBOAT family protein [Bacteroidota bacterium]